MGENILKKKPSETKAKPAASFRNAAKGKLIFAFDFGEYAVKIAMLKIKRGGVEIRHLFSVENRENLSRLDNNNVRSWRLLIQRAFSQRNIVPDNHIAVCTIGGKSFIHRQLEIPYAEEKDRAGLVENEMSQLLALDPAFYVFQHELLEVTGENEDKKCKVWAAAMPKETCNAAYELLRSLKLVPYVMDIHVNGIRRFLTADETVSAAVKGQTAACIDYGMTHTEISFIRDGRLLADTMIDVGDGRLVAEAKTALGTRIVDSANQNKIIVSPEEICNILNRAHTTPEERAFSAYIEDWLSKINTAISRFNFEHSSEPVKKLFIYGGSPQIVWLVQYLSVVTKLPSSILSQTSLYEMEYSTGDRRPDYSAYLNVLNLSLMD